ncbi:unnamed protein product [Notodromas monacha]|uniref:TM2 domain-containing protein n=1 Tax=Notodromas monacha TaxID=399045 RepID=A0A7R9BIR8_9CRUS|nr:unnamed protein product [Notodromas monacha]CAG0915387.1 unnamed protein product [Notodromas monacha]
MLVTYKLLPAILLVFCGADCALHQPSFGVKSLPTDVAPRASNTDEVASDAGGKSKDLDAKSGIPLSKEGQDHDKHGLQMRNGTKVDAPENDRCITTTRDAAKRGSPFDCKQLPAKCLQCSFNRSCVYGAEVNVSCIPLLGVECEGQRPFTATTICQYCYQTPSWQHRCIKDANCDVVSAPREKYRTNCTVDPNVICMGLRTFPKNVLCNWTNGHRWSTAVMLSITLGGVGADRFYLGHWQEGIGKLFSFGGLGVWTLVDVILIATRYLGPADGSLYI